MNLKRIYSQIILVTLKPMIDRNITNVKMRKTQERKY